MRTCWTIYYFIRRVKIIMKKNKNGLFLTGLLGVALFLLIMIPSGHAAPVLGIHTSGQMVDWDAGTGFNFPDTYLYSATGPLYHNSGVYNFGNATAQSIARANYGSLGAYAYRTSTDANTSANASASASFTETFTISNPSLNGTGGRLNIWVDVTGDIGGAIIHPGVSGGSSWSVRLNDSWYSEVSSWDYSTNSGRESYHGYLGQTAMFIYGQPFDINLSLLASAGAQYYNTEENWSSYLNTMLFNLANSQVLDANWQPVNNYTITAASGHDYSAVPIPGAIWLLGSGLIGLLGIGRKFHK
jgi:hypothetical protein